MQKGSFWSLSELKQPVNQWLCIAFLGIFCFWTVLYYFTQKTEVIANSYAAQNDLSYLERPNVSLKAAH